MLKIWVMLKTESETTHPQKHLQKEGLLLAFLRRSVSSKFTNGYYLNMNTTIQVTSNKFVLQCSKKTFALSYVRSIVVPFQIHSS